MEILKECKKAEIFDLAGGLLCVAGVSSGPMGGILLTIPRSLNCQELGTCQVTFYDPSLGKLTCLCTLSSPLPLPDQKQSVRCDILEKLSQEQRREDVKVPVEVKVMLHVTHMPGDSVYVPASGWPAVIKNISAGGVYFSTDLVLPEQRMVRFDFREAGVSIPLTAQILRVDDVTERPSQPLYGYGCRFVNLQNRYENQLRNFVFQEERRRRNNR